MDFSFTEQEEAFASEVRKWLQSNLPERWLNGDHSLPEDEEEKGQFLRAWQKTLYEGGWAGLSWPQAYGGRGATMMEEVVYQREMARVKAPPMINLIGISMVAPTLMQIGTEEQKKRYIHKILTGEEVWCQGYSEPIAGSDLAALQTKAEKVGDKWIINGQKIWTSFAHLADKCFLLARTDNTGKKHEGITAFIVDMHQPGIETRLINQMNGFTDFDFNEVFFTDAVAYEADIVGEVNDGWKVSLALLMHERVGVARRVFDLQESFFDIVEIAKTKEYKGKPLIKDPLVRNRLASYYAKTNGVVYNYFQNLTKVTKRGYPGAEGSIDKLVFSELAKEMMAYGISLLGADSALWKTSSTIDPNFYDDYLGMFGVTIAAGSSEIQRNIIAERILGLPKDYKF